jgi:hypothetical protein
MALDRWITCDTLHVTLKVSSGTIELTTIAGLWIQNNHSKSVIEWKGKIEHSNTALSKIYYPQILLKGNEIRALKESGADKSTVAPLVEQLLALKARLALQTNNDKNEGMKEGKKSMVKISKTVDKATKMIRSFITFIFLLPDSSAT